MPDAPRGLSRRDLLRQGALGSVGLSLASFSRPAEASGQPHIRRRVTLGRTGLEVPDIGFGSFALEGDERLVRHALDRGITHFDTAVSYTEGAAERTLGRALRGRRHEVTLTTKIEARADQPAGALMRELETSLRRLQTDYVDIHLNHAVNDLARLTNPGWQEFVARAKEQGKIRFAGMSGHGTHLAQCVDHAVREDLVDVVLVAFNFSQDPDFVDRVRQKAYGLASRFDLITPQPGLPEVLARAHARRVGVMAMKTLKGAQLNDMRPYETGGTTFAQSAFRFVLSNPHVDALVVTMKSEAMVDEYVAASGWRPPGTEELALLERYEALFGGSQCQPGCGACAASCPAGVPISDVLRARMYDRDYALPAQARETYTGLPVSAAACAGCATQACLTACPQGLPIPKLTADAHHRLA